MTRRARMRSVILPSKLDTSATTELYAALSAARGSGLKLEAGQVVWIGGLAAQLLVSAARTWQADGKRFEIRGATRDAIEGLRLLGVPPEAVGLEAE